VASAVLAWSHPRHVATTLRADAQALALALKRLPAGERLPALLEQSTSGSFEHDLAADVLAARDEDGKVAAVNLALGEIDHALDRRASWPPTALRIALLGAGLLAFFAYLADPAQLRWPIAVVGAGAFSALTCAHAARSGARDAERQRRAVDAVVAAVLAFPPETARPAGPAGGKRRRRRGGS
jgi:hypothetical protein